MIKERIPISGDLGSKVKQLMEYAGWQEGRSVDISIAEKYYADHGVILLRNGDVHFSPFLPSGVLHQLLDLAFEIAGNGDAFFRHGGHLHYFSSG